MFEIKIMLDASDRLADALHHIADALSVARVEKPVDNPADSPMDNTVEIQATEIDAQIPSECVETPEQPEAPVNEEEPKKRKPRSKKQAFEPEQPKDEPAPEPEPEPEPEQPKDEPVPEQPKAEPEQTQDEDALAGKGQSGEVLNELTKKAVQVLDALGIDRAVANRRIREYCAGNEIKFPTFPALLQAVGYAAAIAVCRGEI
jgi:outer membrane biosynthesis protein TonB